MYINKAIENHFLISCSYKKSYSKYINYRHCINALT